VPAKITHGPKRAKMPPITRKEKRATSPKTTKHTARHHCLSSLLDVAETDLLDVSFNEV